MTAKTASGEKGHAMTPKIEPLTIESCDERVRQIVEHPEIAATGARSIYLTLGHHPGLLTKWASFSGKLLVGRLPAKDRELLILRTAVKWRCDYEWSHHSVLGQRVGVTTEDLEKIRGSLSPADWSAHEFTVLSAVDELASTGEMSSGTWDALARTYDIRQLIEVPMVVGQYVMLSFLVNSVGLRPEGEQ
jgi:alkylhydroperoxidase family enzyme